jgi:hypothetical protein
MYRWRPLETARNRSAPMACGPNVDQARPLAGAAALRVADLGWQGDPRRLPPDKRAPPGAIALLGGALAGSGPGTSPYIDGLSLVTGMVVPQHAACSNHADDGGCLDDMEPRGRSVVVSRSWCAAAGEVGFEPPRVAPPGPKLRRSCGSWWYPGRCQPAQQERCPSAVPARSPSSRRLSAGPVSKFVSIGVGRLEPGTARPRPASSPCRPCALGRRARKQGDRERWSGEC